MVSSQVTSTFATIFSSLLRSKLALVWMAYLRVHPAGVNSAFKRSVYALWSASGAPFGYRYVSVREGGGQARFEPVAERARVVQQIFSWIGRDRCSLSEVCRRLHSEGELTATGKQIWSREAVWHVLQNPAYMGRAAYGKTHMMPRGKNSRLRVARGRPAEPRRSNAPVPTDSKEWVYVTVPPLVDEALFRAAHAQLEENRSRARQGRRRPGYLLQGLTCCARCGYAYYGKTIRQFGAGRQMKDFIYYRCGGSDGYRFGGEAICNNKQVQGEFLETTVWHEVCELLTNPQKLENDDPGLHQADESCKHAETLKSQRVKLQHALERLIDSFTLTALAKNFPVVLVPLWSSVLSRKGRTLQHCSRCEITGKSQVRPSYGNLPAMQAVTPV